MEQFPYTDPEPELWPEDEKPNPPNVEVDWSEPELVGWLEAPDGTVILEVFEAREPFGFHQR